MSNETEVKLNYHTPMNGKWHDLMGGRSRIEAPVHEHGSVALVDCMPRLVWVDPDRTDDLNTAESAIVQAARTSYQKGTKKINEDVGLVRYLMRNRHNTPIEMVETKWHCRMPIFVARQWIRHRTASVNEISARYSELPGNFFIPKGGDVRAQSTNNKQVAEGEVDAMTGAMFAEYIEEMSKKDYEIYKLFLEKGVGREMARIGLPLNIYTEWYWKIDLHNLFHFLGLRVDAHAQKEIRDYAVPMLTILKLIAPHACQAFEDYRVNALTLSGPEIEAIKAGHPEVGTNKRENQEFVAKLARLGLSFNTGVTND